MGSACPPLFQQPCGGDLPLRKGSTQGIQHKSWDPNCCLLASLIKADLHFYEWLTAGRKENSNKLGCRQAAQGREREEAGADPPLPQLGYFRCPVWVVTPGFEFVRKHSLGVMPIHAHVRSDVQTPSGSIPTMQSGRDATEVATRGQHTAGDNLSWVLSPGLWDG